MYIYCSTSKVVKGMCCNFCRNAKKSIAKIESLEGDVLSIESKLEGLYTNIKELEDRAKEAIEKQQSIEVST